MHRRLPDQRLKWWQVLVLLLLAPFLLVAIILALIVLLVSTVVLHAIIWGWWCARGRNVLFVYSDSPIWHDYIEQRILPHLGRRAIVLNWSHRQRWRLSLARLTFHRFGGYRQFNPLAVVFRPFCRTRVFRFWQPFRDFKHGQAEPLRRMEADFFACAGIAPVNQAA